jgi:hypothetical protein
LEIGNGTILHFGRSRRSRVSAVRRDPPFQLLRARVTGIFRFARLGGALTFFFENVGRPAFSRLIDTIKSHGVEFFISTKGPETVGTFRSIAGGGTFAYNGEQLTVTVLRDAGHFSRLMIKGGLRQLVQEAIEAPYGQEIKPLPVPAHE